MDRKVGIVAALMRAVLVLVCAAAVSKAGAAERVPDACGLLSRTEIQRAIGGTAAGFNHATTFRGGSTSMCQGNIAGATVTVRVSIESKQDEANEQTIAQMMSSSGGKVETVTAGAVTCTTITPPRSMVAYGYDSMCRISQGWREVAVQASTRDRKAVVAITPLRQLVTLAARRLSAAAQ
ncbi:MAG TPA: hypothetical protein VMF50_09765 [Candidatus Binataceae bacterium]|nr:hypothetical protein [Candidatus Binataceae bacterium]